MPQVVSHIDFIGVYDSALSSDECADIIGAFDCFEANNKDSVVVGSSNYNGELNRKDYAVHANTAFPEIHKLIGERLHECLILYCEHYFVAKGIPAQSEEVKLQRTPPKGGYHVWHCEQDSVQHAARVLVWTIYLNDIPYNEGETEFLWQGIRLNPKAGRCAIWPAAFTHTHRGNPVYASNKYIATGWYTLTKGSI